MDPYKVLGLQPGASQAEIKRAYRRLAKALHPDSAGERSLPAFLAVQEAYEQLTGSKVAGPWRARSRASGAGGAASRAGAAAPGAGRAGSGWQEPWRADPERARAAREQARARWAARAAGGATGSRASAAPGAESARGTRDRTSGTSGATAGGSTGQAGGGGTRPAGGARPAGAEGPRRRRPTRKATMGSTSYDEARDASDPRWAGASWYGPTTGEYWIVNPREYADPRKHGPGYSSRGRTGGTPLREAPGRGDQAPEPDEPATETESDPGAATRARSPEREWPPASDEAAEPEAVPFERSTNASDGVSHARESPTDPERRGADASASPRSASTEASGVLTPWIRALTSGGPSDPTHRLGIALLAWAPVGIAVAAIINGLTGCATYSLACDGTDQLLPWLAQAAILGLLLLVPTLARVLASGTVAMLAGLIPGVAIVIAFGGAHASAADASAAGAVLAVLAIAAWLVGVGWAIRVMLGAAMHRTDTGARGGVGSA